MNAQARTTPRPFAAILDRFKSGADDPRSFLERCIGEYEAREPEVRAFVTVEIESA